MILAKDRPAFCSAVHNMLFGYIECYSSIVKDCVTSPKDIIYWYIIWEANELVMSFKNHWPWKILIKFCRSLSLNFLFTKLSQSLDFFARVRNSPSTNLFICTLFLNSLKTSHARTWNTLKSWSHNVKRPKYLMLAEKKCLSHHLTKSLTYHSLPLT